MLLSLTGCPDPETKPDDTAPTGDGPSLVDDDAFADQLVALEALADANPTGRYYTSDGERAAFDWARAEVLEALGWSVEEPGFSWGVPLRAHTNLVATAEAVVAYVNIDMVGSLNGVPFVLDGDGSLDEIPGLVPDSQSGAWDLKTEEQAAEYGGTAGVAHDSSCDRVDNVDLDRSLQLIRAAARSLPGGCST